MPCDCEIVDDDAEYDDASRVDSSPHAWFSCVSNVAEFDEGVCLEACPSMAGLDQTIKRF